MVKINILKFENRSSKNERICLAPFNFLLLALVLRTSASGSFAASPSGCVNNTKVSRQNLPIDQEKGQRKQRTKIRVNDRSQMKIVNKPNNGLKGFPILSKLEAKALTAKVATISSLSSLVLALAAFFSR